MKNIYKHAIELAKIHVPNAPKDVFMSAIEAIPYRGYEVESLADERKIVIAKPGGKRSQFGQIKKEDFFVYIYDPKDGTLWQISHKQILDDLSAKSKINKDKTIALIDLLEKTLNGEEPDDFIHEILKLQFDVGESAETLIKVYKWIWGQEDVNYPNHDGRMYSWPNIDKLRADIR